VRAAQSRREYISVDYPRQSTSGLKESYTVTASKSAVRVQEVGADHADRRLDNFLATILEGAPRAYVYRVIRSGEVRVNGRRASPGLRLAAGDKVRIPPFAVTEAAPARIGASVLTLVEQHILHEDERLIVLNKPAGLAVHGGSGLDFGLIDVIRALRPGDGKVDLVHRLDRETSGCLLFARDAPALRELHRQLREGEMNKAYVALLSGSLARRPIACDAPLAMAPDRHGERRAVVSAEGAAARTLFSARTRYAGATLAAVTLDTGRTHQIRAHAAHLDHPVAGDERYGDPEFNKALRALGLRRLFLHAERLRFRLDRAYDFSAPLPAELAQVLGQLDAAGGGPAREQ
jgi:23S rRNA pseudouridine955/2504/2580 synthase